MSKKLSEQLQELKICHERLLKAKELLQSAQLETDILSERYNEQAEKLARAMQKRNLNEITNELGTFRLKRTVKAKIINRTEADEYDQRYRLGLFVKSVCGPRLKAWATQQLEKNLKVPAFVSVQEVWTVEIV